MNTVIRRVSLSQVRRASTATHSSAKAAAEGKFAPKTFKEAWLSDVGSFPVIASIVAGGILAAGAISYFLATKPDSRIADRTRKSLFRGEITKEYQHPVKEVSAHH